ncbi:winged helix-turn-helix domain-containing protein [Micromonospora olivasterospora]|uniref:winged helix-turn-helix domain-containing protein n=1 Tax=Micromonospora olivasterospora TaxID=1880 RepID=UPI00337C58CA
MDQAGGTHPAFVPHRPWPPAGGPAIPYPASPGNRAETVILTRPEKLQPNRAIPSESRLVQEYGIARATVRRAVAVLVDQGVLFVVPQRGTFVKP